MGAVHLQIYLRKTISVLCLLCALFTISIYGILCYYNVLTLEQAILFTIPFSMLLILGTYLLNNSVQNTNKQRNLYAMWMTLLIFYVLQMIHMLFFSSDFARDTVNLNIHSYQEALQAQWLHGTNLVPFATIKKMVNIFSLPAYSNSIAIINLFGNMIAFTPCAFFFLLLAKKAQKVWKFALFMSFIIILVEVTQFFTCTGSMDIDDYILNFTGVMVAYGILKIPKLQKLLKYIKGY